jgi:hypothetical protein
LNEIDAAKRDVCERDYLSPLFEYAIAFGYAMGTAEAEIGARTELRERIGKRKNIGLDVGKIAADDADRRWRDDARKEAVIADKANPSWTRKKLKEHIQSLQAERGLSVAQDQAVLDLLIGMERKKLIRSRARSRKS